MLSLTLKSIRSNPARFLLTGVAVILGIAFMAGTLVLTDTIKKSYDDITLNVYKSTDAVVRSSSVVKATPRSTATPVRRNRTGLHRMDLIVSDNITLLPGSEYG